MIKSEIIYKLLEKNGAMSFNDIFENVKDSIQNNGSIGLKKALLLLTLTEDMKFININKTDWDLSSKYSIEKTKKLSLIDFNLLEEIEDQKDVNVITDDDDIIIVEEEKE